MNIIKGCHYCKIYMRNTFAAWYNY